MVGFTVSFCSCWKEWICISCKNITLGEKSPNLFNIAHWTPDCLFYELKIICHDFTICCYDHFPFFLISYSFWPLTIDPSSLSSFHSYCVHTNIHVKREGTYGVFISFYFLRNVLFRGDYILYFYPHLISSILYASFKLERKCLSGFFY